MIRAVMRPANGDWPKQVDSYLDVLLANITEGSILLYFVGLKYGIQEEMVSFRCRVIWYSDTKAWISEDWPPLQGTWNSNMKIHILIIYIPRIFVTNVFHPTAFSLIHN